MSEYARRSRAANPSKKSKMAEIIMNNTAYLRFPSKEKEIDNAPDKRLRRVIVLGI